jgi:eukaryotic-like serine/threonine-protein kinase
VSVNAGAVLGGRFVLDREAGAGGMGTVFRALDRTDAAPVAVKVLRGADASGVERFTREAGLLAELQHPGIVRYVAHGVAASGERYLAMEWLEGEDLAARLLRRELGVDESITLLLRVADALAFAHARGVVHRDLKPHNLFLPGGDVARVKVVDFGIASVAGERARLTCTGVLLGTVGYMGPEQLQGAGAVDPRTDVFSLGCVLFECLTGRPAFEGTHPMAVAAKILLQGAPRARSIRPDVPEPLDDLVHRMLAKRPEDRPRDAAELAGELVRVSGLVSESPASAPEVPSSGRGSWPPGGPGSLGLAEKRLVSVVLAGALSGGASGAACGRAGETVASEGSLPELGRLVEPHGGRIELAAGSSLIVTVWSSGDATDRAERAARCALALLGRSPAVPLCVVTGRGLTSARLVSGELIDRGVGMLRGAPAGAIRLDEATASALGPRFLVARGDGEPVLEGARAALDAGPVLLGKPTPCLGRERELVVLEGVVTAGASESSASVVLVTGPAGAGKSRLLRELSDRIGRRGDGVEILYGRGDSLAEGSPFGMIADALRRAAGIRDGEPLASRRLKLRERVGRHLGGAAAERVAAVLGEILGVPCDGEHSEALTAARASAQLMGDAKRAAWEEWLSAECAAHPVLLALDDLHWGDSATVRLVDATLRSLDDRPLCVVALARPEVHARFPGLWEDRQLQTLRLGALSRRAGEALVRGALGEGATPEVVARIVDHGGGNPFHMQELVRAVAAGRGDALPDSVLDAVEARLDAQGSEAKRILRAASVFGERFSREGVAALTAADPASVGDWLSELAARELVGPASSCSPRTADEGDYVFRHALVREAAYATLTDGDRALGHRLAGEWLTRAGHADAQALAEHFRRGGCPERAGPWYQRAAEDALEASDLGAAIERADRGLSCGAVSVGRGALRVVQAEAHVWRGELALAEACGLEAAADLPAGSAPWFRAVSQVVLAAGKLGGFDRVESWVAPALAALPAEGAAGARIVCLSQCATYLIFGGRYAAADRLIEAIDRALPDLAEPEVVGLVHQMRSIRASAAGDLGACLAGLSTALGAFEQAGDHRNACAMRANLGFVFAELGDFARAEEALRAALAAAERMGLHDLSAVARQNLGRVLGFAGKLDEARRLLRDATAELQRQGDRRMEGVARTYLAEIALRSGDVDTAEREARAAVEALDVARPLQPFASAVLAQVLLARGHVGEALATASEAHAALETMRAIEEGESLVRLVHAEALGCAGLTREHAIAVAVAHERLLERAARIADPEWRRRYLTDVPDNARTLALVEREVRG